ncbi:MAG: DUF4244 domain-containing protein [Actinomycetales bacterium]|jgi:hypothetical protein|nr:DUF4244 domain-containing protein [Actinomycetales bacterium]
MRIQRFIKQSLRWVGDRWRGLLEARAAGMVSAEYAVGILAAVAFALLLLSVMRSDAVRGALTDIVSRALSVSA